MKDQNLFTEKDACEHLGTYPRVWKKVVEEQRIPFETVGGRPIFSRLAVEKARPHVDAWKNRPRLTSRPAAATA